MRAGEVRAGRTTQQDGGQMTCRMGLWRWAVRIGRLEDFLEVLKKYDKTRGKINKTFIGFIDVHFLGYLVAGDDMRWLTMAVVAVVLDAQSGSQHDLPCTVTEQHNTTPLPDLCTHNSSSHRI